MPSRLVHAYVATAGGKAGGKAAGTAYFDTHRVRTLPETVMVVLDPSGKVRRVEVLSFNEPQDYLPGGGWYGQFAGRGLDERLALKRDIRPLTGATLTARATTGAVRRVLAVHRVLQEGAAR
ncbi:MAG TPA: FMN-binding protein [Thermoanaerobaculia bacterium]|nr:FMN-binding protein [Thermoanaerobaculia bacterium]